MIKDRNMASLLRPLIVVIVCGVSMSTTTESGLPCILTASPDTVGSMECKFDEEVFFIQVDYYKPGSVDPPVIAVSCDPTSCEPNSKFADMLKVRGSPGKQLLTLTLHGVPPEHAGKYRCQAQSVASTQTKEGVCSLWFPNTGQGCSLMESSQSVGSMECTFSEEVQYIQLDFYGSGSTDPPEIAVSCDQTFCDPNAIFADMLEVRNLSKQLLTLEVHEVSQAHAGNYRCQAQSIASTRTVDGICSIRYPIPAQEITTESPAAKKESDILYYVLLVLLVLPIAATVILLLCICKRKSLGPWKKQDSVLDDTVGPAVGAGPRLSYPEAQPLVTLTNEGVADRSLPAGQSGDGEGNAREEESRIILDDGKDTADSERQSVDVIANNRDDADVGDVSHVHRSGSDVIRLPTCETNEDNVDISLNAVRRQFQ